MAMVLPPSSSADFTQNRITNGINLEGAKRVKSPYVLRHQFAEFHARHQRFAVLVCHRRMGKTVACINDLVDKAIQCNLMMPRYGYVAPFYTQAKQIAWNYLKYYAGPLIEKVMESELTVILRNGALIRLHGADNPDSLRGVYWDGIVLDEYGDMQPRLFGEIIMPALADRDGWVVFVGTPKGPNHFCDIWEESEHDARWFRQMSKASETGIFTPAQLQEFKEMPGSDEESYEQEFECDFRAAVRGAYYGKIINELESSGHLKKLTHDPKLPVVCGWDLGISDDTSIWFCQRHFDGIAIIDFFTVSGYAIDDIVEFLKTKPYSYAPMLLPHDANSRSLQTGKTIREQLWAHGIKSVIVPQVGVQNGIQAVRKTLPTMYFDTTNDDVKLGLNALRLYQREWDDKRKIFKQAPLHDWCSNPADAMRMLCLGLNPGHAKVQATPIQTEKKPITSNVMSLERLFAEREARSAGPRRI